MRQRISCAAVIDTAQYRMADRLVGGTLPELLAKLAPGRSYEGIARELYARHGIEVSRPTIARWLDDLGIDKDAEKGSTEKQAS